MKKVGICGHLGIGKTLLNGQTIKTKNILNELEKYYGRENIEVVDSHGGIKAMPRMIVQSINMFVKCKNIIIFPAYKGIKVFVPLYSLYNLFFHRKIHYVVIGGWLTDFVDEHKCISRMLKNIEGIYVETFSMKRSLDDKGFKNVIVMPNFKKINFIERNDLVYNKSEPYKLCTFSRVMEEKGIEDAIWAVNEVNTRAGRMVYTLDIYGEVWKDYTEKFEDLKKSFPNGISYRGVVPFNQSVEILKNYFALLFPTKYKGEGFAGTLLDAMAAGVPVVASNWKYNHEVVVPNETGVLIDDCDKVKLAVQLWKMMGNPKKWNDMKVSTLKCADSYKPEKAIRPLLERL